MILAVCLCERYIVTHPGFFGEGQYIHQTNEWKIFKTCAFKRSETVFPDPARF